MKKIILILTTLFLLGCGQVDSIINYFAELTTNEREGTTETEFIFEVSTNDEIIGIYANDELLDSTRSTGYTFKAGTYVISVETKNGASDELTIIVEDVIIEDLIIEEPIVYETRFILNVTDDDSIDTPMELNYPILTLDGVDFDLEEMAPDVNGFPVKTVYTDTERLVYIDITCSWGVNSFIFRNAYNWAIYFDFLREDLNVENMQTLIARVHYVEPVPTFDSVLFNLSGTEGVPDSLELTDDSYLINGVETTFMDAVGIQVDTVKTVDINIIVGDKDSFVLRDGNLIKFFGYDTKDMTKEELLQTMDVLDRYPGESLLDIVYDYWPSNPVLVELGYFD